MPETPAATKNRTNPFKPFMPRILAEIIKPHIQAALDSATPAKEGDAITMADVWRNFRSMTGSTVSASTFKEWIEAVGGKVQRTTSISL